MRSIPHRFLPLWATLFAISFAMNCLAHRPMPVTLSGEPQNVSLALQHGRGFSDPFATGPSGPTAHLAPLFPMLHAAICLVFGTGFAAFYAILAVWCLAWSLHCVLVQRFASFYGRARAGTIAALVLALLPFYFLFFGEGAFAALAIVSCACLIGTILAGRSNTASHALLGGMMAIGTLLNPATILIWGAWAVFVVFKLGVRPFVKILLPAALVFAIPVGGWTARNYRVFHHLFFVRDNLGLELAESYNDCALRVMPPTFSSNCYMPFHPNSDPAVERVLIGMGEFQFNLRCREIASAWMRAHPAQSIAITAWHFFYFWIPIERAGIEALLYGIGISIATLLSLSGVSWRRNEGFQVALIAMLSYSTIYYFFRPVPRFRCPVLWVSVLLMVVGIETWAARRKPQ